MLPRQVRSAPFSVLLFFVLLIASSCSGSEASLPAPFIGAEDPAPPDTLASLGPLWPLACDSPEMALLPDVLQASKKVSETQALSPRPQQDGRLSLLISLETPAVRVGEVATISLTVTNVTDDAIIFIRPAAAGLDNDRAPDDLLVDMSSPLGQVVAYVPSRFTFCEAATREAFTVLPAGQSCTMKVQFKTGRELGIEGEALPPGDYRLTVSLQGAAAGPPAGSGNPIVHYGGAFYDDVSYYDVGAFMGNTGPSNGVTMTVVPGE